MDTLIFFSMLFGADMNAQMLKQQQQTVKPPVKICSVPDYGTEAKERCKKMKEVQQPPAPAPEPTKK